VTERGKFITLEGGEGAGKSTQVAALADAIRAHGIDVVETREPGGSEGAERIRELLLTGSEDRWGAPAEALLFASKAGADPAKVRQALMGGFASSRILEVHGERMIKRTFDPGFRIELHQKDLNLALANARHLGVALPNTATAQELFNTCVAHGGAKWDHSALVRALETMANHEVGQRP